MGWFHITQFTSQDYIIQHRLEKPVFQIYLVGCRCIVRVATMFMFINVSISKREKQKVN